MKPPRLWALRSALVSALLLPSIGAAGQVSSSVVSAAVQIDVSSLLNDRVVFTAQGGQLQPALHAVDSGDSSVLITKGAAALAQSGEVTALPDNDLFAANDRHPAIKLHYARPDGGMQVRRTTARTETYSFEVPNQRYRRMQLFFIGAQGETPLAVQLYYADGTIGKRTTIVPDFYFLPKQEDPRWFVLTGDFGKVNLAGKMTEATHHYLHGFDLNPDPTKKLLKVEIAKQDSGSVLNFFAATGLIAESGSSKSKNRKSIR
jgi:hypothetical protein